MLITPRITQESIQLHCIVCHMNSMERNQKMMMANKMPDPLLNRVIRYYKDSRHVINKGILNKTARQNKVCVPTKNNNR